MGTHVHAQYLEDSFAVLCFRNGSELCPQEKKLEATICGEKQKDTIALSVWNGGDCSRVYASLAKIL